MCTGRDRGGIAARELRLRMRSFSASGVMSALWTSAAAGCTSGSAAFGSAGGDPASDTWLKSRMATTGRYFMVPPGCQELDEPRAADDRQPQADEIGELFVDAGG